MNKALVGAALAITAVVGGVVAVQVNADSAPSGCVRRPAGTLVAQCMHRTRDPLQQSIVVDQGDENVMPASEAIGNGCVAADCVATSQTTP